MIYLIASIVHIIHHGCSEITLDHSGNFNVDVHHIGYQHFDHCVSVLLVVFLQFFHLFLHILIWIVALLILREFTFL